MPATAPARRLRRDDPARAARRGPRRRARSPAWPTTTARVEPGSLFFCVPGFTRDGHDFAPDAVARGRGGARRRAAARARRARGRGRGRARRDGGRRRALLRRPDGRLPVVGITGTNGKTTTAFLVRSLLEAAGRRCGLLGTVKSVIGGEERPVVRTTPEAIDLQRTFAEMLAAGDEACAMEISSHALELRRADGIHVAAAVFTNLTQDHLDFHPDMEAYFQAKRLLFASPLTRVRIVNADDPYGRRLAEEFPGTVTFAIDAERRLPRRRRAAGLRRARRSPRVTPDGEFDVRIPLPGRFNVLNALGAWARRAGARRAGATIAARAARAPGACPGASSRSTRGSRSRSSSTTRTRRTRSRTCCAPRASWPSGRVIAVFGGRRRPRPRQAPADGRDRRARLADVAIVTSDNPRSEDPEAIIDEIVAGIATGAGRRARRRPPRGDRAARSGCAEPGDVRRDRRQGPRAGPGVRGRAQGAVRRRRGRARGAARGGRGA